MSQPDTQPIQNVDFTPDAGLPVRILRVYRGLCEPAGGFYPAGFVAKQAARAAILDRAISRLERGGKTAEGMSKARARGRALGRPVALAKYIPQVKRLHRQKLSAPQIYLRLRGKVSVSWIRLQLQALNK